MTLLPIFSTKVPSNCMFRTLKNADWFPADGFPISVEWRRPQPPFPRHRHEFSELVIVTGGKGTHVVGQESWPVAAGDVFVIGGMEAHEYRDLENLTLVNILFQADRLKIDPADLAQLPGYHALFGGDSGRRRRPRFDHSLHLAPRALGPLLALVDQLDDELRHRGPGFRFLGRVVFMQIVGYLCRCYGHLRGADSRNLHRINEVVSFLEANTTRPVKLDHLAKLAHMSKRNFIRAFRDATGVTPIAYSIQLRINRAAALLRSDAESITEVAFCVGFTDSNYFTRQFRKLVGASPRRYREQHHAPPVPHHSAAFTPLTINLEGPAA